MKFKSKLGLGPMSADILDILFDYSDRRRTQIMIIPSTNQVNIFGGYVEDWNTDHFMCMVQALASFYKFADVKVCRDHLMLGNGSLSKSELFMDISEGFDLIHLDASDLPPEKQLETTLWYIRQCMDYGVAFEVGTDINNGAPKFDADQITRFLDPICQLQTPEFFVHQTGSLIKNTQQVGTFNEELVQQVRETIKPYGVKLKEHNADYLTLPEIKQRRGLVDALNIAPQLGAMQTEVVLEMFNNHPAIHDFIDQCFSSFCWVKWIDKPIGEYTCKELAIICGHYNFTHGSYKELLKDPDANELMRGVLRAKIFDLLDLYMEGLSEDN